MFIINQNITFNLWLQRSHQGAAESWTVCAKERKAAEETERRGTEAKEKGKKREDVVAAT